MTALEKTGIALGALVAAWFAIRLGVYAYVAYKRGEDDSEH